MLAMSCVASSRVALCRWYMSLRLRVPHQHSRQAWTHQLPVRRRLVVLPCSRAAAIRVVPEPYRGCPVRRRHGAGPLGEIHGQPVAHRLADRGARVQIQHHGEREPALRGLDIAWPGPHPVGLLDLELPVESVRGHQPRAPESVVTSHFFSVLARIPSARISRAMRCSPMPYPRLIRAAQMRGLPSVSRVLR